MVLKKNDRALDLYQRLGLKGLVLSGVTRGRRSSCRIVNFRPPPSSLLFCALPLLSPMRPTNLVTSL